MILDTHGELAAAYQFADVAFVGGTIAPIGGHSIMEPALFGKAIVVGPHMENFGNMVDEFVDEGAMIQISALDRSVDEQVAGLSSCFERLLTDPDRAQKMGQAARQIFERSKGATAVAIKAISEILDGARTR
jgi:3-deoxy-D-manno-octulosonic-acid transferase